MRMSVRRTVSEAEASIPWLTDEKSQHTEKDPAAGKDWRQMEKGVAEKEMVRSQWIWISKLWEMRTEEAVLLQSMGLQWVGHNLATEQQQLIYGKINLNLTSYIEINSILITELSVTCNMYAQSHHSCLFATLWTIARQAPLSMGFFRQWYQSGLPCPPPGDLPYPGTGPLSLAFLLNWQVGSLPLMLYLGTPTCNTNL